MLTIIVLLAFACARGTLAAWLQLRTDHCGRIVGAAGTWEAWLFVAAVLSIILSVRVRRPSTGRLTAATVVVADLAGALLLLGSAYVLRLAETWLSCCCSCTPAAPALLPGGGAKPAPVRLNWRA